MVIAPAVFLRFAADQADLLLAVFERGDIDEAELLSLIARYRTDASPTIEHVRRQLDDLGILERSADAENVYELSTPIRDLLAWLTHHQRLSSSTVLRGYMDDLRTVEDELTSAIQHGDSNRAALALKDIDSGVERLRSLSEANRESIVTSAQELRSAGGEVSAVKRFQTVRHLWERFIEPLRQLVDVQGEMEGRLSSLRLLLNEAEQRFTSHGAVQRASTRSIARVARLQRLALDDHHASVTEIAPLYERLRRESGWVLGASLALRRVRADGVASLDLDRRLGLVGWRTRYLMSDEKLRARLESLVDYPPTAPVRLDDGPPAPVPTIVSKAEVRNAVLAASPISDVLGFVLDRWPLLPLAAQLRAFGYLVQGDLGLVDLADPAGERLYPVPGGTLHAWPLRLELDDP